MRIYLTGFMGSGKTTVGRELANKLRFPFYDLDSHIEDRSGLKIPEIFDRYGEEKFRLLEREALYGLETDPAVIATGGGCFIYNREWMLKNGAVVYLQIPFSVLVERVGGDVSRPLWKKSEELYAARQRIYESARFVVDGTRTPDEIAEEIVSLL